MVPMINGVPWWFDDVPLVSVDPRGRIATILPPDRIVGCVVHASSLREGPASVRIQKVDHLIFGEPVGGVSARVTELAALFDHAKIPSRADPAIRRAIWYKAWGNMTMNPISALTLATADQILGSCRSLMLAAMEEARAIGNAIGCPITESGEARLAVAETRCLQDIDASGRRGWPTDRTRRVARGTTGTCAATPRPRTDAGPSLFYDPADGAEPWIAALRRRATPVRYRSNPIRTAPWAAQKAVIVTSSPSSRKLRVSPLGNVIGALPPFEISSSEPSPLSEAVDSVPVPIRSPDWRLQPFDA